MINQFSSSPNLFQLSSSKTVVTQKYSFISEAEQCNGSHSPTSTLVQRCPFICSASKGSSPSFKGRHVWISSDSFFCEDFTLTDFNHLEDNKKEQQKFATEHWNPSQVPVSEGWMSNEKSQATSTKDDEREIALTAMGSPSTLIWSSTPSATPSDFTVNTETSPVCIAGLTQRQHWVKFDASPVERSPKTEVLWERVLSTPTLNDDSDSGEIPLQLTPPCSPSKVATIVKHKNNPISVNNYSGRLIRTYSQRGHRASKRIICSVSRRMSASEYGRLPESRPPMYSKAAMTMQSGPGLFEETQKKDEFQSSLEEVREPHSKEFKAKASMPSKEKQTAPRHGGSVRVPRVPSVSLQRSASAISSHEKSSNVPFQKLTIQRPGSFRRILSALTSSFRKNSNGAIKSYATANQKCSTPKDTSNNIINDQQTPQAPRLPRRATKHTYATTHTGNPKISLV